MIKFLVPFFLHGSEDHEINKQNMSTEPPQLFQVTCFRCPSYQTLCWVTWSSMHCGFCACEFKTYDAFSLLNISVAAFVWQIVAVHLEHLQKKNRSAKLLLREHGTTRKIESLISPKFGRDHFLSRIHGLSRGIFSPNFMAKIIFLRLSLLVLRPLGCIW